MSDISSLDILDAGVLNPVGDSVEFVSSAVAAGVAALGESQVYGKTSSSFRMALVPDAAIPHLNPSIDSNVVSCREKRLITLAGPAIRSAVKKHRFSSPVPLFIATPEGIPRSPVTLSTSFLERVAIQSEINIDIKNSRTVPYGRSAGIYALELAFRHLRMHGGECVLVGGVDSYLDLRRLSFLDMSDRVKVEGSQEGFFPGEGSCFLLVKASEGVSKHARIQQPAFSMEKGHIYSSEPHRGEALSEAVTKATESISSDVQRVYSSQNGEQFYTKEFGVMMTRNNKRFSELVLHIHPSEFYGDLGAASSSTMILLASKHKDTSLVYGSSDMGHRAAVCVN